MAHFSSPQWIDLVRGLLAGDIKGDMENHLNSGCRECLEAHSLWHRFTRFADDEKRAAPPEEAVSAAKSFIAGTPGADSAADGSAWAWAASLIPTLVFDSLQEALPAGVRAAAALSGRCLLYAANDLMIDLHIDVGARAGAVLLAGQVANAAQPGHPLPETRVALVKEKEDLAAYRVNALGEFHCEFERQARLALLIAVQGREPIVIPLERLFEPTKGNGVPRSKHSRC